MPIQRYGALKGRPVGYRLGAGSSPHFSVHIVDDTTDYRIAINVKSKLHPSELLYLIDDQFTHPYTEIWKGLATGFTQLDRNPTSGALDYIRSNLFDRSRLVALPHSIAGPDNDLNEKIQNQIVRAINVPEATLYAFGERWGPEPGKKDKHFGFLPGNGIHDIHMNQGNVGQFTSADGVWQDGALFIHFPAIRDGNTVIASEQWIGVILAFQSQSWHTDDSTGHSIRGEPDPVIVDEGSSQLGSDLRIVAALVNPEGQDQGFEAVTLINTSTRSIDLKGWRILDKMKRAFEIPPHTIAPGETHRVKLDGESAQLGNNGGLITLITPEGLKAHGVSYTKSGDQGKSIVF